MNLQTRLTNALTSSVLIIPTVIVVCSAAWLVQMWRRNRPLVGSRR